MKCRGTRICALPGGGAHETARRIEAADLLVAGSPTYWGNVGAALKNTFERMVPVFMDESPSGIPIPRQKGEKAVIVTACTTPFPFNVWMRQSRGTVRAVRETAATAGYRTRSLQIGGSRGKRFAGGRVPGRYHHRLRRVPASFGAD